MMEELTYTLLSDGSSDQALLPILTWLLRMKGIRSAIQPEWADLRPLRQPPRRLADRILCAVDLYPCDLLFVHRDAEAESLSSRTAEIQEALTVVAQQRTCPPGVCVVPVRMQEAWLLFDAAAIRQAAGNRHGSTPLVLPPRHSLESLPDPKQHLYDLLREASGLTGRRRDKFRAAQHTRRVAELIADFAPLRALEAFRQLEADIERVMTIHGWG